MPAEDRFRSIGSELIDAQLRAHRDLERISQIPDAQRAVLALVETGRELLTALEHVVADDELWTTLRDMAYEADADSMAELEFVASSYLRPVLEVAGYRPPPPVEEFIERTRSALSGVSRYRSTGAERFEQVTRARDELDFFVMRFRGMLRESGLVEPVLERSVLSAAVSHGATLAGDAAPAAVGALAGAGSTAVGIPGEITGPVADRLTLMAVTKLREALRNEPLELRGAELVRRVEPTARVRGLLSLIEATLLRCAVENVSAQDLDGLRRETRGALGMIESLGWATDRLEERYAVLTSRMNDLTTAGPSVRRSLIESALEELSTIRGALERAARVHEPLRREVAVERKSGVRAAVRRPRDKVRAIVRRDAHPTGLAAPDRAAADRAARKAARTAIDRYLVEQRDLETHELTRAMSEHLELDEQLGLGKELGAHPPASEDAADDETQERGGGSGP